MMPILKQSYYFHPRNFFFFTVGLVKISINLILLYCVHTLLCESSKNISMREWDSWEIHLSKIANILINLTLKCLEIHDSHFIYNLGFGSIVYWMFVYNSPWWQRMRNFIVRFLVTQFFSVLKYFTDWLILNHFQDIYLS